MNESKLKDEFIEDFVYDSIHPSELYEMTQRSLIEILKNYRDELLD